MRRNHLHLQQSLTQPPSLWARDDSSSGPLTYYTGPCKVLYHVRLFIVHFYASLHQAKSTEQLLQFYYAAWAVAESQKASLCLCLNVFISSIVILFVWCRSSKLILSWWRLTSTASGTCCLSTMHLPLSAWPWRSTLGPQTTERGSIAPSHHVGTSSSLAARMGWRMSGTQTQVSIMFKCAVQKGSDCVLQSAGRFVSTGDQVAVYSELCYPTALHGVCFHPHENMVAFCAFGQRQPVHVYLYDRKGLWRILFFSLCDPTPESLIEHASCFTT